jgi:hypothetical protein
MLIGEHDFGRLMIHFHSGSLPTAKAAHGMLLKKIGVSQLYPLESLAAPSLRAASQAAAAVDRSQDSTPYSRRGGASAFPATRNLP